MRSTSSKGDDIKIIAVRLGCCEQFIRHQADWMFCLHIAKWLVCCSLHDGRRGEIGDQGNRRQADAPDKSRTPLPATEPGREPGDRPG